MYLHINVSIDVLIHISIDVSINVILVIYVPKLYIQQSKTYSILQILQHSLQKKILQLNYIHLATHNFNLNPFCYLRSLEL